MTRALPTPLLDNFTVYDSDRVVVEFLHSELFVADLARGFYEYRARFDALLGVSLDAERQRNLSTRS